MEPPSIYSSSDEDGPETTYVLVTDPTKVKELQKKQKKQKLTPAIVQDDRQQTKPVMITNKSQPEKGKQKETDKSQNSKKQRNEQKYKEKNDDENSKKNNQKKPKYEQKTAKKFKEKVANLIEVQRNDSVEDLVKKVKDIIKENNFIVLEAMGSTSIERAFLAVQELHNIYKHLKRINIPATRKIQGKFMPMVKIQLSLKENELNADHIGYQQSEPVQKRNPRKNRNKQDSDDQRQYR